jgi:hypothetical protein
MCLTKCWGRQVIIKNGEHTFFWKDSWLGDKPICVQAPVLFDWCEDKDINVYQFLSKGGQLLFNRWLPPMLFECCLDIINQAFSFSYENCNDIIKWKWGGKGHFTSKFVYDHLQKMTVEPIFNTYGNPKFLSKLKYSPGNLRIMLFQLRITWRRRNGVGTHPACFVNN